MSFNKRVSRRHAKKKKVHTGDHDRIIRKGEHLTAHDVDHGGADRVVRDEEAGVDRRRVVLLDAARYERDEQEVSICACVCARSPSGQTVCSSPSKRRTGDHMLEFLAPPKRNDDLAPPIVASDEPVRVREHIRELGIRPRPRPRSDDDDDDDDGRATLATYDLYEPVAEGERTEGLIHRRRVHRETLETTIGSFRDESRVLYGDRVRVRV